MSEYDLLVIGAGSGGIACARRAASYGAKVLVFESNRLGGTCVNVGCVPKKVMWNASHVFQNVKVAGDYGIVGGSEPTINWAALKVGRDKYITRLNGIYENLLANSKVEWVHARASLKSPGVVVADGKEYRGKHVLIATGGVPSRPDILGAHLGIDSNGFFELKDLPKKAVIMGAGYIAVEIAGVLASLGSQVDLVVRSELLRSFDRDIAAELEQHLVEQGVRVHKGHTPKTVHCHEGVYEIALTDGSKLEHVDCLLWATGRKPNTAGLGLEHCSIDVTERGYIKADSFENTTCSNHYALGDVNGKIELTPVAIAAGRKLAARLFLGEKQAKLNYDLVATVVFSHPPIGTVGMGEAEAKLQLGKERVEVHTSKFTNMVHALSEAKPKTFMKIIVDKQTDQVVGVHGIGEGMDEIIQGFGLALKAGATKQHFQDTVAIHPTAAEELVTMF